MGKQSKAGSEEGRREGWREAEWPVLKGPSAGAVCCHTVSSGLSCGLRWPWLAALSELVGLPAVCGPSREPEGAQAALWRGRDLLVCGSTLMEHLLYAAQCLQHWS